MRMRRALGVAVVLICVAVDLRAHQLDEYLQAARLAFRHDRLRLELDLTPGVAIASAIIARVDSNGDQTISPLEARAYAQSVLADVAVTVDGHPVALTLESAEIPSVEELHDGVGTIQLRAAGAVEGQGSGRRQLHFRNNHLPDVSVYLVNALRSGDRAVRVVSQLRDSRQREIQIEYSVDRRRLSDAAWLVAGLAGLVGLVVGRRRGTATAQQGCESLV